MPQRYSRHEQTGQNNTAEANRQAKSKTQQAIEGNRYPEVHDLIMTTHDEDRA